MFFEESFNETFSQNMGYRFSYDEDEPDEFCYEVSFNLTSEYHYGEGFELQYSTRTGDGHSLMHEEYTLPYDEQTLRKHISFVFFIIQEG